MLAYTQILFNSLLFSAAILGKTLDECNETITKICRNPKAYCSVMCLNTYNSYFTYKTLGHQAEVHSFSLYSLHETLDNEWPDYIPAEIDKNIKLEDIYIRNKYHYPPLFTIISTRLTTSQNYLCADFPLEPAIQVCCVYDNRKRANINFAEELGIKYPRMILDTPVR